MKINQVVYSNYNFGRAFSTKEKQDYSMLLQDSRKELGLKDTTAIVFDFNVPSEQGKNIGIGTSFSNSMNNLMSFLKTMTGVTSVQLQPQGKISQENKSPYSGTNYAFGEHLIDLQKLTTKDYAQLLSNEDIENITDEALDEYRTNYPKVIGQNGEKGDLRILLEKAYTNFTSKLEQDDEGAIKLNKDFSNFKTENQEWLEKDSLFEALASLNSTQDISKWSDLDQNLYNHDYPIEQRQTRIDEIKKTKSEEIEFNKFIQFLLDKEQKESRKTLNSQDIALYGDCLIGFSQSEMWANKNCFRENLYYGGPDPNCNETNNIQTWGLPALDYTKLGKCDKVGDTSELCEVGKFLLDKYKTFFKRYDGIRMDAAWQFVTPFIYQAINGNYEEVKFPEINFTIFNIMSSAAKEVLGDKFDENNPDNIMLELVGMNADKSREMTLNKYPHLYTTAYSEYNERPKKFIDRGYLRSKFHVGVGCHDNESLVNMAKNQYKRDVHDRDMQDDFGKSMYDFAFSDEGYQIQSLDKKIEENYRTAKFAETFTAEKQFFTLMDMFGMSERINISGKESDENWTIRLPENYEKFYFSQLQNGYGLNMPKALLTAMQLLNSKNTKLMEKCKEASEILREQGPTTEIEANKLEEQGLLNKHFEYVS